MLKILKRFAFYMLIFILSFVITAIIINQVIKIANKKAQDYTFNFTPNINYLQDGNYQGSYRFIGISLAEICFTLNNNELSFVEIPKLFQTPGSLYKKEIQNKLQLNKSLDLDAISGATRTSNFVKAAIKDAIENSKIEPKNITKPTIH